MNIYGYSAGNPTNKIDPRGLCWSAPRAFAHYSYNSGADLSMQNVGCESEVTGATLVARLKWEKETSTRARQEAIALKCVTNIISRRTRYTSKVGVHSGSWWIGGIQLNHESNCLLERICDNGRQCVRQWKFYCQVISKFRDPFEQPFDLDNDGDDYFDKTETGTIFHVTGEWYSSVKEQGSE